MSQKQKTTYRVTGNTYAFRDDLRKIGRWDAPTKSWIVTVKGTVGFERNVLNACLNRGCTATEV